MVLQHILNTFRTHTDPIFHFQVQRGKYSKFNTKNTKHPKKCQIQITILHTLLCNKHTVAKVSTFQRTRRSSWRRPVSFQWAIIFVQLWPLSLSDNHYLAWLVWLMWEKNWTKCVFSEEIYVFFTFLNKLHDFYFLWFLHFSVKVWGCRRSWDIPHI